MFIIKQRKSVGYVFILLKIKWLLGIKGVDKVLFYTPLHGGKKRGSFLVLAY